MPNRRAYSRDVPLFATAADDGLLRAAILHAGNPPGNIVTISIGYGVFRGPRRSGETFENIDAALYRAKAEGRDRLCEAVLA